MLCFASGCFSGVVVHHIIFSSQTPDEIWLWYQRSTSRMTTHSWTAQPKRNHDHHTLTYVGYDDLIIICSKGAVQQNFNCLRYFFFIHFFFFSKLCRTFNSKPSNLKICGKLSFNCLLSLCFTNIFGVGLFIYSGASQ
ncbi:hypothetical protein E2C01_044076 [Portunus trituberculatus]|uniref:Uncharacterized protein n=1 Tax=Portunus trituberculatus TaxID=210409 RepID=A0A5B7FUL9_PORTR|nr:hypothetical protein [Portunus trituberculatus]